MREHILDISFLCYYFLQGLICYVYYRFVKKDIQEPWFSYVFVYYLRLRGAISLFLAIITRDLILYGFIL